MKPFSRRVFSLALGALVLGPAANSHAVAQSTQSARVQDGALHVTLQAERGWLGLSLREVLTPVGRGATPVRLVVTDLFRGGPAERGGLRTGDVLVRLNGARADIHRFRSVAERLLPGDPLALTVLREGRVIELAVEAGAAPEREEIVRQVVQVHLDSARVAFAPRLDSLQVRVDGQLDALRRGSGAVERGMLHALPHVQVSRVDGDSLRTRVMLTRADGSTVLLSDGVSRGSVSVGPLRAAEPPRAPSAFIYRRQVEDSVVQRFQREAEAEWSEWRLLTPYVTGANRVAGAEFRAVDAALGSYFGVDEGVLVLNVAEGTPARRAGLEAGDVIVEAAGHPVTDVTTLRTVLARSPGPVALDVIRRGRTLSLQLPR